MRYIVSRLRQNVTMLVRQNLQAPNIGGRRSRQVVDAVLIFHAEVIYATRIDNDANIIALTYVVFKKR